MLALGAEDYRLYTERLTTPEYGSYTRHVLVERDVRLTFVGPRKWTVKYDPAKRAISLVSPDLKAGITVTLAPAAGEEGVTEAWCREQILARYPGAKMDPPFRCYTETRQGWGLDFKVPLEAGTRAAFRSAFVGFDGGVLRFEMKAATTRISDFHDAFGGFLSSFRIEPAKGPDSVNK
jgi:hypothetical protein